MLRWIAIIFLTISVLQLSTAQAQELYESEQVVRIQAEQCGHNISTRQQTGFLLRGTPGIFTALHGIVDCQFIQVMPKLNEPDMFRRLKVVTVNLDHDIAKLCDTNYISDNPQTDTCNMDTSGGFDLEPATSPNRLKGLQIIGYPNGAEAQYTIEMVQAAKTSTVTLGSLVGPALKSKLQLRNSPKATISVIPIEGTLAPGMSGSAVLNANGRLVGMGDGSQTYGLSWLIDWNLIQNQMVSISAANKQIEELIGKGPEIFLLSATQAEASGMQFQRLSGIVQSKTGLLSQAKVTLQLPNQLHRVYTDSNGQFLLVINRSSSTVVSKLRIEAEGYEPYIETIELPLLQESLQEYQLKPVTRPRPISLKRRMYVRTVTLVKNYQSPSLDTSIDRSFAPNIILLLVAGPEQTVSETWWKVRRLEDKAENSVWIPVADGQTVYVEAIDKLGRNDCVSTLDRLPFQDQAGADAEFVTLETDALLRVVNSRLVEKEDALWVQVERIDSPSEQGWVEYVGTAGINLQPEEKCEITALPVPTPKFTLTAVATPQSPENPSFPVPEYPTCLLIGEWQAQIPNNNFQMQIDWDEKEGEFKGFLTQQGNASQSVGFTIGEFFYSAKVTNNTGILQEQAMHRWSSTRFEWQKGTVNVNLWPSNNDAIFVNNSSMTRIGEASQLCKPSQTISQPPLNPSFPVPEYPTCLLIGEWEAQIPDNNFQMRIDWDENEGAFKGFLTQQGNASQSHGFTIGEFIYSAKVTNNAGILQEQSKWRWSSTQFEWRKGTIDTNLWTSRNDELFYNSSSMVRIGIASRLCKPFPTYQPTATATPMLTPAYPCEAKVFSLTGGDIINRVRGTPSSQGALMPFIEVGTKVEVRQESRGSEIWYHIFDEQGRELGWILSNDLQRSSSCPP